ncbi:hypothetical protein [Mumia zhuanghuii]|nr:hypothetical protein [Mumia zhuanghuii]
MCRHAPGDSARANDLHPRWQGLHMPLGRDDCGDMMAGFHFFWVL